MDAVTYLENSIARLTRERAGQVAHNQHMAARGVACFPPQPDGKPAGTAPLARIDGELAALQSLATFVGDVRAYATDHDHGLTPDPARLAVALRSIGADTGGAR